MEKELAIRVDGIIGALVPKEPNKENQWYLEP